jgi:hypothetical protein
MASLVWIEFSRPREKDVAPEKIVVFNVVVNEK